MLCRCAHRRRQLPTPRSTALDAPSPRRQLFNAVRAAQKEAPEAAPKKAKRQRRDPGAATAPPAAAPLDLSRDSFLDILRRGTGGAKAGAPSSSAAFLRDDFMLGESKSKYWGRWWCSSRQTASMQTLRAPPHGSQLTAHSHSSQLTAHSTYRSPQLTALAQLTARQRRRSDGV